MRRPHYKQKKSVGARTDPFYILLDIHGVFTDNSERKRFLEKMEKTYGMEYDKHNALWVSHLDRLDKGLEKASDYISVINKTFHTHFLVKEYYDLLTKQIIVNRTLLRELQAIPRQNIYIISDNFFPIPIFLNRIFGKQFKQWKKFYSFQFGMTKSKGLLEKVTNVLAIDPEQCIFIDDNSTNIAMGKKIGIDAILFTTNEEILHALETRNVFSM